jgi:hypothetical protein
MYAHMNPARVVAVDGSPTISEAAVAGAGTITFMPPCQCTVFKPGESPISWLKSQKCADGAILTTNGAGQRIAHLVELKSKLTGGMWEAVKQQLEGMLHNVRAFCGVAGVDPPADLRVYVAFKTDAISKDKTTSPVLMKSALGGGLPFGGTVEWETEQVTLLGISDIPLIKVQRDAAGDGEATLKP